MFLQLLNQYDALQRQIRETGEEIGPVQSLYRRKEDERKEMQAACEKLKKSGILISFTDSAIDTLCNLSYEPQYGARPVKRAVNDYIINGLTMKLLSRDVTKEKEILIDAEGEGFIFSNLVS